MRLNIRTQRVVPNQALENKLGYFATIEDVFPCKKDGTRIPGNDFENAEYFRVLIQNVGFGSSSQIYGKKEFAELREAYHASEVEWLKGKPVISVYTKKFGQMLTGLIPLGSKSTKVSF